MSYWVAVGDLHENMTSNVACMWREAGCDLRELKGTKAKDAIKPLCDAINRMLADPEKYKAMEPTNGWGTYNGCVNYLRKIHDACMADPEDFIHVSY